VCLQLQHMGVGELILYKVFRVMNDQISDRRLNDMLIPEQHLFLFDGTSVTILNPSNQEAQLMDYIGLIFD
jgi:hypothetical protein